MTHSPKPILHQNLPGSGGKREALRAKGQFWTPAWVAEAMVAYVLAGGSDHIFDPAVGEGAFFRATRKIACEAGRSITLLGREIDPKAITRAQASGLSLEDLQGVEFKDFLLDPPARHYRAIVANPPYIRHHRLDANVKTHLKAISAKVIGQSLDGRAGLHIYFLLGALRLLEDGGRLAFIMPADTCEGVFAPRLWKWIARNYRLDAVITFETEASPFPGVDTNAVILLLSKAAPQEAFIWARVYNSWTDALLRWILSDFTEMPGDAIQVHTRQLMEGLTTGLSRPFRNTQDSGPILGNYASVLRGIATGHNEFFFMTKKQASLLGIPSEFLRLAVGRTRDVDGSEITEETMAALDAAGRPTLLLSLDGRSMDAFPPAVREYLRQGEKAGLPEKALISQRRPWYKMEVRRVPPFLFAYLGRRNTRFIRNRAGVVPLTGFLCVYPHHEEPDYLDALWEALQDPETTENLSFAGKSYGSGAIKVEPRALEQLRLPRNSIRPPGEAR